MSTTVPIVKTPDVLHGKPRLEGTRIGVFTLGELVRRRDWSREEVSREFDLDADQIDAALQYYDEHPELVETLRAQHAAGVASVRELSRSTE
jgi:uncharacterized protein (DUF433 family)